MNEKSNTVTIGFRTRGIWTTNDLTLLSTSIGNIYDLFLTKNIFHKSQVSYWENLDHWFHEYEKYIVSERKRTFCKSARSIFYLP
ncbi:MAG: hypothetical protein BROFUL_02720, partial [Candidatus Brocadia fulgida]